jgi:NAD(P)-dependent dehydrogenase (short-subunit alcohol dehydrogenase family)
MEVAAVPSYLGIQCDITDATQVEQALSATVGNFGGLDMLILNAGIFPASQKIADLPQNDLRRVMNINFESNLQIMQAALPALKNAPQGGRVVMVASKNVPAPGPGAAAYSASKAALTQLARVAALEWGEYGIRVNVVHPNQVFDTALWTDDIIAERAARYGLSVEEYRTSNVLKTEITSADVARMVSAMCGANFAKTTGAQIPVDGGNDRVI